MNNVVELGQADLALILAIHPRGNTVVRWEEGEEAIRFIYKRKLGLTLRPSEIGFKVLFPAHQEVLCSEYLRVKGSKDIRLKHLLLPVGRGMKSIDIFGANESTLILGQVSFTPEPEIIEEKVESLKSAVTQVEQKKVQKVYFGPPEAESDALQIDPDLTFISLEKVFEEMKDTGILEVMLGVEF